MNLLDRGRTVLAVDDELPNRQLLARVLADQNCTVHTAGDGEAALTLVRDIGPDVVLLDVNMPGIDGFEVCRRIKDDPRTRLTPVVLITALNAREHRICGIDAGADDFISKPFDSEELRARVRSLMRLKGYTDELDSAEAIIMSLALTIEARDGYTKGHCERLARYATAVGRRLNLTPEAMAALHRGAYLHDIGKIGVPDSVLLKADRLSPVEYALMKEHPVIGDRLCGTLRSLELVRPIVRHHHELSDGSGYPDGLRGDQIPLLAQIVGIVDTYDAITTDRPYRPARSPEEAYSALREETRRGLRRPDLVDLFLRLCDEGEILRLSAEPAMPLQEAVAWTR